MKNVLLLFLLLALVHCSDAQVKKEILYVGTNSVRGSKGIYAFTFNRAKQTLTLLQEVPSLESPTFIAIHPTKKFLYSVNRGKADIADQGGSVSSYGIDPITGRLSGMHNKSSYGEGPCHVVVDRTGEYVFVSHYGDGNLTVLSLFKDGQIGSVSDAKKFTGNSINAERQQSPHIHSTVPSHDNKFLYVMDLGTDKIYIYEFNAEEGTLTSASVPEVTVVPGAGPRHFVFHPSGDFAYLAEELTSTVASFSVDKVTGTLSLLQDSVISLPENFTEQNTSADIHTDVSGKFLYVSNRGANVLSIFSIANDGKIKLIGHQDTNGKVPRNFLVDPKGDYIFVANQESDSINIFKVNSKTGKLTAVGKPVSVPSPVCLKLVSLN